MDYKAFEKTVKGLFPGLSPLQLSRFESMEALYREWNSMINVISRKDIDSFYPHHVLHSLAIAAFLMEERPEVYADWLAGGVSVLDLGTGGGFPGIPLAVLFPKVHFTLCDSIGKKIKVASSVASSLGLENVSTVCSRAENLPSSYDFVVSRAVATLSDFYPWIKGRYRRGILCLKGGDVVDETGRLEARYPSLKGASTLWKIPGWDPEGWFEGKFVVEIAPEKAK